MKERNCAQKLILKRKVHRTYAIYFKLYNLSDKEKSLARYESPA
jgi:hypothetical protein